DLIVTGVQTCALPIWIVRAGGEGAGSMVTGAGAVSLGRKALTTVAPKAYSVMEGLFGKPTIENAAIGAASGAGGQAAAEVSPEEIGRASCRERGKGGG